MIDFNKLRDPEVRKQIEAKRKAEEARVAAKDKANRFMWEKMMERLDDIDNDWERDFLQSLSYRFGTGLSLSEKQEAKLTQIFERW